MTGWLHWMAILILALATYLAALTNALMTFSRHSLERKLEARQRAAAGRWLAEHLDDASSVTALLRTAARLGFFVVLIIEFIGLGEAAQMTLTRLLVSAGVAVLLLWLFTSVLSMAIARYAGAGLIVVSLPMIRVITILGWPLRSIIRVVDETVKRLTGANISQEEQAEAQLLRSIEETHLQGGLDEDAATLLENVVEFGSTDVGAVMTPRTDIDGLEMTNDLREIRKLIIAAGHSRIPVYKENLDNIVGILYVKDLVPFLGETASNFDLLGHLRKPIVVPETKPVRELLADFQSSEVHMAIVIDEYGGTAGLVTIEDVLEEIVGEIHDEHEPAEESEPELRAMGDRVWDVDGRYRIDDLNEELEIELPEDEEYDTVAGFLLTQFGRVPEIGESIECFGARFEILNASPTHIRKASVQLLEPASVSGRGKNGNGNGNGAGQSPLRR